MKKILWVVWLLSYVWLAHSADGAIAPEYDWVTPLVHQMQHAITDTMYIQEMPDMSRYERLALINSAIGSWAQLFWQLEQKMAEIHDEQVAQYLIDSFIQLDASTKKIKAYMTEDQQSYLLYIRENIQILLTQLL